MNEFELDELLSEFHPIFPVPISPSNDDIMNLSKRLDHLTIDINTQNLTIELEKMKRRKLRQSVRQLKSEILSLKQTTTQLRADNDLLREQVSTLSSTLFSEIACLTTRVHCCLGRIHQTLIAVVPYVNMPEGEHREVAQVLYEILRVMQLIRVVVQYETYV